MLIPLTAVRWTLKASFNNTVLQYISYLYKLTPGDM